ncbi:hypothetical protein M752DRAFT_269273 [Aspergillus phoenicis ATCC 13157]|uniref:Uncharacterized protein n=1 Tax=Aspergillus phoenicis ATCC 13157 TaxID=1353007 RepID=A0A370PAF2_ASPPH|nr:hypothetical protein M752DRAFT_269273 [Aspergillus phoenicis ATCC 13157]
MIDWLAGWLAVNGRRPLSIKEESGDTRQKNSLASLIGHSPCATPNRAGARPGDSGLKVPTLVMEKATIGIGRQKNPRSLYLDWQRAACYCSYTKIRIVVCQSSQSISPRSVQTPLEPIDPRLADSRLTPPAREIVRDYWRVPESYHHLRGYYDLRCVFLYGLWELVKGLSNGFNSLPSLSPTLIAPGNSNPSQGRPRSMFQGGSGLRTKAPRYHSAWPQNSRMGSGKGGANRNQVESTPLRVIERDRSFIIFVEAYLPTGPSLCRALQVV